MTTSSKKSTAASKKPAQSNKAVTPETTAKKKASPAKAPAKAPAPVKRPAAVKAAPPAKTTTAKAAAKPAAAKAPVKRTVKRPAAKAVAQSGSPERTRVSVDADIGFGNHLFLRGEGPGLSWDHGVPMTCTDASHWEWSTEGATEPLIVKVLINDQLWSHGENFEIEPGQNKVIQPEF